MATNLSDFCPGRWEGLPAAIRILHLFFQGFGDSVEQLS